MIETSKQLLIDNPKNVIIKIKVPGGSFIEIDVTQSFSYRIEESKKPVYGFKDYKYNKVLQGKSIVSGAIVIKKHAKDSISSKLRLIEETSLGETVAEIVKNKFETIYEIFNNEIASRNPEDIDPILEPREFYELKSYDNNFFQSQLNKFSEDVMNEQIALRIAEIRSQSEPTFNKGFGGLLALSDTSEISIQISFNSKPETDDYLLNNYGLIEAKDGGYDLLFENVKFVSKEAQIVVGSVGIDEVYSFMANIE